VDPSPPAAAGTRHREPKVESPPVDLEAGRCICHRLPPIATALPHSCPISRGMKSPKESGSPSRLHQAVRLGARDGLAAVDARAELCEASRASNRDHRPAARQPLSIGSLPTRLPVGRPALCSRKVGAWSQRLRSGRRRGQRRPSSTTSRSRTTTRRYAGRSTTRASRTCARRHRRCCTWRGPSGSRAGPRSRC
jgi:hypothetical protein